MQHHNYITWRGRAEKSCLKALKFIFLRTIFLNLLQEDLNNLSNWSESSGLNFNELKSNCNCQTVTRKRALYSISIPLMASPLEDLMKNVTLEFELIANCHGHPRKLLEFQLPTNFLAVFDVLLVELMTLKFVEFYIHRASTSWVCHSDLIPTIDQSYQAC